MHNPSIESQCFWFNIFGSWLNFIWTTNRWNPPWDLHEFFFISVYTTIFHRQSRFEAILPWHLVHPFQRYSQLNEKSTKNHLNIEQGRHYHHHHHRYSNDINKFLNGQLSVSKAAFFPLQLKPTTFSKIRYLPRMRRKNAHIHV